MKLRRFWFEFEKALGNTNFKSIGVTAWTFGDAFVIIKERFDAGEALPNALKIIEDVDITTLDQNHVIPNMGAPTVRGIWFPNIS